MSRRSSTPDQWAPFEHFRDTVARLQAAGQVPRGIDAALVSTATSAENHFLAGQDVEGCDGLASLRQQIDAFVKNGKEKLSATAHAELSRQVALLQMQFCQP